MLIVSPLAQVVMLLLVVGVLATGLLLVRKGLWEARELSLSVGELELRDWPEALRGWRLLHVSDVHFTAGANLTDRVLSLAEAARPDCIIVTGDLLAPVNRGRREAKEFLWRLAGRWPVYLAPGNEDHVKKRPQPYEEWPETGAVVLMNRAVPVVHNGARCWIAGVDDPHTRLDDLEAAFAGIPEGEPVVLLAHSPAIIKRPGIERAAVIFSGHTHGGQICLPNGYAPYIHTPLPHRFASGVHQLRGNSTLLVVSRGAGTTRLPLRLWCPPELTLWTIVPSREGAKF